MLDLLYPRVCASCRAPGRLPLCEPCDATAAWIDDACTRCALPACDQGDQGDAGHEGGRCDGRGAAFDRAASAGRYEGAIRDALIGFKVLGERRAAAAMAARMLAPLQRLAPAPDTIVTFVPSGRASMRQRGFNPAQTLAIALAMRAGLRALPLLRKSRETLDLAGLDRAARRRELAGAFSPRAAAPRRILLVDDVLTTGATGSACAAALKEAGASAVDLVTFARAL